MGNIVQTFTMSDIQDAIIRADASTPDDKPIQRFGIGFDTVNLTRDLTDRDALASALGTKREIASEYSVPTGYLRCYTSKTDWFEVKINSYRPGPIPAEADLSIRAGLDDTSPIVTGGSTPGGPASSPVQTIKAHLQVAESNLAQARRLIDTLPLPD